MVLPSRLPQWIKNRLPSARDASRILSLTYAKGLATVCKEARCPNQGDCAAQGTATFLIMGDRCTRNCRFCAVHHDQPGPLQRQEPRRVAESVAEMRLSHAVITSVTRDDIPDGGASHFAETINAIRKISPATTVEVLIPDFRGSVTALRTVLDAAPDVLGHNLETVPRLYPLLRPAASYERSLNLLRVSREIRPGTVTKSGIMVGAGESFQEITEVAQDLARAGCAIFVIGQYLRPTRREHPVARYLTPEEFGRLEQVALATGIFKVVAGPLVRSSYKAGQILQEFRRSTCEHGAPESK